MAAAKALEAKKASASVDQKIKFAGQTYQVSRDKTASDIKQEQRTIKNKVGGACGALDAIVNVIDEKEKNVTSLDKSKLDWDKYTRDQKLEGELEQNRKDGFLAKK